MTRIAPRLALILCLMLTGIGLGAARGQVQVDGHIVLCTGQGIVTVDAPPGSPAGHTHICPDMALSLLAAVHAQPATSVAPRRLSRRVTPDRVETALRSQDRPVVSARDPPDISELSHRVFS